MTWWQNDDCICNGLVNPTDATCKSDWTMLTQMKWMDEDDMKMFGVSDLYDYVKGMANFGVW